MVMMQMQKPVPRRSTMEPNKTFSDLNPCAPSFQISAEERRRNRYSVDCVDFSVLSTDAGAEGFLKYLRLKKYIPLLAEKGVSFLQLLAMNEKDLYDLGITADGPRVRLLKAIARYHLFQASKWDGEGSASADDTGAEVDSDTITSPQSTPKNRLYLGSVDAITRTNLNTFPSALSNSNSISGLATASSDAFVDLHSAVRSIAPSSTSQYLSTNTIATTNLSTSTPVSRRSSQNSLHASAPMNSTSPNHGSGVETGMSSSNASIMQGSLHPVREDAIDGSGNTITWDVPFQSSASASVLGLSDRFKNVEREIDQKHRKQSAPQVFGSMNNLSIDSNLMVNDSSTKPWRQQSRHDSLSVGNLHLTSATGTGLGTGVSNGTGFGRNVMSVPDQHGPLRLNSRSVSSNTVFGNRRRGSSLYLHKMWEEPTMDQPAQNITRSSMVGDSLNGSPLSQRYDSELSTAVSEGEVFGDDGEGDEVDLTHGEGVYELQAQIVGNIIFDLVSEE